MKLVMIDKSGSVGAYENVEVFAVDIVKGIVNIGFTYGDVPDSTVATLDTIAVITLDGEKVYPLEEF